MSSAGWRVREYHPDDLDGVLHLWEQGKAAGVEAAHSLPEVLAACREEHAVVAIFGDDVVGAAVGRAAHDHGWILFFAVADAWRDRGIGSQLLIELEKRMAALGLTKISGLLPETAPSTDDFLTRGFSLRRDLHYVERRLPVQRQELGALSVLGGRVLPSNLWDAVGGMHQEKDLLERRLVTPLANPDVAARYGVVPPQAVVLFGPPGTGKTTFAKAIASRLEWPFVEVFPSRLAVDPGGLAGALRETFLDISELEHVVVFIDEVEEIAAQRHGEPPSPLQGVTNELLKIIPAFREQQGRLLVCATNFIRSLDSAFLRHGRFDYVIPIGLPDEAARRAIWERYIPDDVAGAVDVEMLVSSTQRFSPADIEYAARKASQSALEQALNALESASVRPGPSTNDYVEAVRSTRTTVSDDVVTEFLEDIERIARL